MKKYDSNFPLVQLGTVKGAGTKDALRCSIETTCDFFNNDGEPRRNDEGFSSRLMQAQVRLLRGNMNLFVLQGGTVNELSQSARQVIDKVLNDIF